MKRKKHKAYRHYRKHLHSAAKIHGVATVLFLGFYFSFAFVFGPKLLWDDIIHKYNNASAYVVSTSQQVSVTAHIAGLPGKPSIFSTFSGCSNGNPFTRLDWSATTDTDRYDIYRNNDLLAQNLTLLFFQDNFIQSSQQYSYRVVAKGIQGQTSSDEKQVTAENCYQPDPSPLPPEPPPPEPSPSPPVTNPPTINQLLINGKIINLDTPIAPNSKKKKPVFSGIASVANAKIRLEISSKKKIVINLVANTNGYWRLKKFPKNLKKGNHNMYISVIDPKDSSNVQSYLLTFRIGKKGWVSSVGQTPNYFHKTSHLFAQSFLVAARAPVAYQGKAIEGKIELNEELGESTENTPVVNYKLVDWKNKTVLLKNKLLESNSVTKVVGEEKIIPFSVPVPYSLKEGKYKLVTWISGNDFYLSDEKLVEITELPLLTIDQNTTLTRSNLINYAGWIAAIAFASFISLSLLALIEYHLSKNAPLRVSEDELKGDGLIS